MNIYLISWTAARILVWNDIKYISNMLILLRALMSITMQFFCVLSNKMCQTIKYENKNEVDSDVHFIQSWS